MTVFCVLVMLKELAKSYPNMKKCVCDKCNKIVWLGNNDDRKHGVLCSQCSHKRWVRKNHSQKNHSKSKSKSKTPSNLEILVLVMSLLKMILRILK